MSKTISRHFGCLLLLKDCLQSICRAVCWHFVIEVKQASFVSVEPDLRKSFPLTVRPLVRRPLYFPSNCSGWLLTSQMHNQTYLEGVVDLLAM